MRGGPNARATGRPFRDPAIRFIARPVAHFSPKPHHHGWRVMRYAELIVTASLLASCATTTMNGGPPPPFLIGGPWTPRLRLWKDPCVDASTDGARLARGRPFMSNPYRPPQDATEKEEIVGLDELFGCANFLVAAPLLLFAAFAWIMMPGRQVGMASAWVARVFFTALAVTTYLAGRAHTNGSIHRWRLQLVPPLIFLLVVSLTAWRRLG